MDDSNGNVRPYMDPILQGSEKKYASFINDLDKRGLLRWTQTPRVQVSVFFVRKKSANSLRMIIDCRPTNRHFADPPSCVLAPPESLARMEVDPEDSLFVSTIDVKDCFYIIKIDQRFSEHFALPPLDASLIDSCKGKYTGLVWPCIAVLPMGFSWSLFFAQEINRDQVVRAGMTAESELNAHSADSSYDKHALRFLVYVDNIAIFGRNADLVNDMMRRVESRLNDVGLLTHELTVASTNTELLGLVVKLY